MLKFIQSFLELPEWREKISQVDIWEKWRTQLQTRDKYQLCDSRWERLRKYAKDELLWHASRDHANPAGVDASGIDMIWVRV